MIIKDILLRQGDLGTRTFYHKILTKGPDFQFSRERVLRFFQKYKLVNYSHVHVIDTESVPASSNDFEPLVKEALLKNRRLLHNLIEDIQEDGYTTIQDLQTMQQGYKTRIFHVITHLVEGFFGLDTQFYNLEEDSHWVSEELWKKIRANPPNYWLVSVKAEI